MSYKSAFTTICGKHEFLRMSFGLGQGPGYFTALVQKVLGQFNEFCFFHMDDVLLHNSSENDYLEHLKMIFQQIRKVGLKLKLSKLAFLKDISNIQDT